MKTILIVDDVFENLYLLRVILIQAGYNVVEANDGKEALDKLTENRVDLIISDILMPVMDGYMFCQACKKDEKLKDIPFVFYTSTYTEKVDEDFALKLGAARFLRKPTDPDHIIALIKRLLDTSNPKNKAKNNTEFTEEEVLKLYSKRLISKLEQKNLELEKEITERSKIELKLTNENAILDLIANNTSIKKVFNHIIHNYQSLRPEFYLSISLLEDDKEHLRLISAPNLPKDYCAAIKNLKIGENIGSCGTSAYLKKPIIVSDISTDPLWENYRHLAVNHDLKSCWSIPILSEKNEVFGTFAIYSSSVKTPTFENIRELNSAVSLAKMAIVKFNMAEEVKKKEESYESLVEQATDAILTYTYDGVIHNFNKATYTTLGYTKKEFLKLKIQDFIIGDVIQNDVTRDAILKGEAVVFDRQLVCKDQTIIDVEVSAKLQKDGKVLAIVRDVSERKKAEAKLLESEYNLRQSQIVANLGSYAVDLTTMTWDCTELLYQILGIDESFVRTIDSWVDLIHTEDKIDVLNYFDSCVKNNTRFNKEYRVIQYNSKKEIWVHGVGELLFDDNSNPIKMIGTMQNITERKAVELKLQKNEKSLLEAQKIAKIGSYYLDLETSLAHASITFKEIAGLEKKDTISRKLWKDITHPEDAEINSAEIERCIRTGQEFDLEYRIYSKTDNKLKWIHGLGEVSYQNGKAKSFFGTIQDITERKTAEIKIKESEQSLSTAQKIAKIGSFNLDLINLIAKTSDTFNEIVEYETDKKISFDFWKNIVHPDDRAIIKDAVIKSEKLNKKFDLEYRIISTKTKQVKWIHGLGEVFYVDDIPSSFVGTIQDITDRKKAEIDLKIANDFTESLVMSMQEGLLMVNLNGTIMKVNESLCDLLGYTEAELLGMDLPYPFARSEDYELMMEIKDKVANGEAPSFQLEFIRKNGTRFTASFLAGIIYNNQNEVIAIFATIKDISEELKIKETLKQIALKSTQKKDVILKLASLIGEDLEASLKKIAITSAEALQADLVTIWEYKMDKTELVSKLFYNAEDKIFDSEALLIKKESFPNYFEAFKDRTSINISNVRSNPITKAFAKQFFEPLNISSRIDVVIYGQNEHYGILSFETKATNRTFNADEESFVTSIASIISLMVEGTERKIAENKIALANEKLLEVNKELNVLRNQLEQENVYLRNELDLVFNFEEMVYGSVEFSNVLNEIEKVAPTNATVLLLGESGTGKELLARAVHNISNRNSKPLIKVNCSAIPRELIESELFGHKKGSFTGAFSDKIGKFELADGGTLFLDEIGELPLDMQPKILRFLQEGEIEVVGGLGSKKLDVRVIAATNRNLLAEIEKKQFREDLYFRLNVFPIAVPALRDRKDDIPLLVEHFVDKFGKTYEKQIKYISDDAMSQLKAYNWPGNIRELENLIERALILSNSDTLIIPGFETTNQKSKQRINSVDLNLDTVLRNHILQVLEDCKWKISGSNSASEALGLKPSTLRDKMNKLGIVKPN
ncbi:sigma 54-interacting transcriptional regulator [Olleya sp. AS48]|uniref:sigma 54-interacting transcriptional regulator n=1 Tax=Olleya sp. AS48 TaxID=3135774 RepID=UPI003176795C